MERVWQRKMCHAYKEKRKTKNDGRNKLPSQEKIRTLEEKGTYKYLWILEADTIKQVEIKHILKIYIYISGNKKQQLETKLYCRNLTKWINTWTVPLVRYLGSFFQWTREEFQQINQGLRKLMTMHKAFHPRGDIDRLYVSRKEWGRGLASIEDSVLVCFQSQTIEIFHEKTWTWLRKRNLKRKMNLVK